MTSYVVTVEFDIDGLGSFTDFTRINDTCKVLGDGKNGVEIVRGARGSGGRIPPTTVIFDYQDDNALLNDENGDSPYYRKLVEFTPMIVTVDGDIRAYVELVSIKVKSIQNDTVILTIEGAGIKRRLGHGIWQKPLRSPAYRALSASDNNAARLFYAPLEEASGATRLEVYQNIGSIGFTNTINFGAYTAAPSAERMLTFGTGGQIVANIPSYTSTQHKVCMLWTMPDTSLAAGTSILRMYCTGGNIDFIDLEYGVSTDGTLRFVAYKGATLIDDANFVGWAGHIIARHFFISLEFEQNGSDLDTGVLIVNSDSELFNSDPLTGVTIGRITTIVAAQEDSSGASFGQLIVGNDTTAFSNYISPTGYSNPVLGTRGFTGEAADERIARLCQEEGINLFTTAMNQFSTGDGVRLGPQQIKPFLELLELAAEADGGMLYEDLATDSLRYRTRRAMYNQAPQLRTTYAMLTPPLLPTRDDQGRQNDVTVANTNGTTARYIIPDSDYLHYSTQAPPTGMSTVPGKADLNLYDDDDAMLQAAWRAHLGSWRAGRISSMVYNMTRSVIASNVDIITQIYFTDPGNTVQQGTTGATKWVPPGHVLGVVQGYKERVAQLAREFSINITPGDAWEVKVTDSDASILANPLASGGTTMYVDPGALGSPWTLNDRFYAQIDGDVFQVDASFDETPTFINAGAIANGNNAAVTPALPAGITVDVGQSLFIWATIRNSGTGTPDDEPGWTTLVSFGNTKLYHRYYETGVTAPQITFTGGVANADTQARMFAFSGISRSLASGTKASPAAATLLNSSAQNVAYPALTLARDGTAMMFLWKQDDATGYAPPGSMTEMADNSTTTGDDSSIAAYYELTGANFATGSVVVTGGASAISRAVVLAFRPLQSFFITRNILGNAAAHAVGDEIHVWRQGVTGL